jgi:hypothetical protein
VEAFNPLTASYDPDVVGIDAGIAMLMAENYRTRFVWDTYMKNPKALTAMQMAGFVPNQLVRTNRSENIRLLPDAGALDDGDVAVHF